MSPPRSRKHKKAEAVHCSASHLRDGDPLSSPYTLKAWLQEGPFTLVLSSSFFGFYAHAGVLAALLEVGAVPSAVAGSSGGAIIAGMWAAGMSTQQIVEALRTLTPSELLKLARPWREFGGVFSVASVQNTLQKRIEEYNLAQNLENCNVPVALSAFDVLAGQTRVLSTGSLASAIAASLAVPLFFTPVWYENRPLVDGGIGDIAGLRGVGVENRVLYHHACVVPARMTGISRYEKSITFCIPDLPVVNPFTLTQADTAFNVAKNEMTKGLHQAVDRTSCPQELVFCSAKSGAPRQFFNICCSRRYKRS